MPFKSIKWSAFQHSKKLTRNAGPLQIRQIFCKELRTLFVPGFLNCWLAKQCLEVMLVGIFVQNKLTNIKQVPLS